MRTWIAVFVVAVLVGYMFLGSPDAAFRSSDGRWADSEFQSKGRSFAMIVDRFETYKLLCHAPDAVLLRTTPAYTFNLFAWPGYRTDKKWRVPYAQAHPEIGDYFPPASIKSCANDSVPPAVIDAAHVNAERYRNAL